MVAHPRTTLRWRVNERLADSRFMSWLMSPANTSKWRYVPSLPRALTAFLGTEPPVGPRSLAIPPVPDALKTAAGIPIDAAAAAEAYAEAPPALFTRLHHEVPPFLRRKMWTSFLPGSPGFSRAMHGVAGVTPQPRAVRVEVDAGELTAAVKAKAHEIGLSAVGVAQYDQKWVFEPVLQPLIGDRVIVCVLEQNWDATQTIPSARGERAALNAYSRGIPMADALAEHLRSLGYAARAGDAGGPVMSIAFAVAAGLGQLGLNGQLLTPFAGSRCRLFAIVTDAPLLFDAPVDYGVPAICDACQVCVRRCPSGAISSKRQLHRGVYKAKIKTERCIPMMAAAEGCAVCMKVCPVQRYGLPAVLAEFERSGSILGKGTDELEGYTWPVDGAHYGPGAKPRAATTDEFLRPNGLVYDPQRKLPVLASEELTALNQRLKDRQEIEF